MGSGHSPVEPLPPFGGRLRSGARRSSESRRPGPGRAARGSRPAGPTGASPIPRRGRRPARCWGRSASSRTGSGKAPSCCRKPSGWSPSLLGAHLNLAQAYLLQGNADQALPLFRRVLELDPKNATARMALARAETEKGNYKKSLELAPPVLAAFKESPEGLLILAAELLEDGGPVLRRRARRPRKRVFRTFPPPGPSASPSSWSRAASSRKASTFSRPPARRRLRPSTWPAPWAPPTR